MLSPGVGGCCCKAPGGGWEHVGVSGSGTGLGAGPGSWDGSGR